jgi:hypothetical protein
MSETLAIHPTHAWIIGLNRDEADALRDSGEPERDGSPPDQPLSTLDDAADRRAEAQRAR